MGGLLLFFHEMQPPNRARTLPASSLAGGEPDGAQPERIGHGTPPAEASLRAEDNAPAPIDESFGTVLAGYAGAALEDRLAALRYLDPEQRWPEAQRAALLHLALQDPVEEMRMAALLAVENGYFGAAFLLLEKALSDRSPDVRAFAVDALAASGDPRIIPALQRALFDREDAVRARVLDNLELLDPQVQQPVLLRALESPDDLIATTAIQALWEVVTPEVIPPVLRLLDSPSAAKREATRRFLSALFNTSFVNRVEAERWWAAHHARYDELLRPLAGG